MIQRIQTVWLFLAAVLNTFTLFTELWRFEFNSVNSQATIVFHGQYIKNLSSVISIYNVTYPVRWVFILCVLFIIGVIATIFMYKKRRLQKRMAWISSGLAFLQTSYIFARVYYTQNQITQFAGTNALQSSNLQIGVVFPILSVILCLLASYYIEKDERMVKDMNSFRLRD
jgi:glucose uptake protein GlcU